MTLSIIAITIIISFNNTYLVIAAHQLLVSIWWKSHDLTCFSVNMGHCPITLHLIFKNENIFELLHFLLISLLSYDSLNNKKNTLYKDFFTSPQIHTPYLILANQPTFLFNDHFTTSVATYFACDNPCCMISSTPALTQYIEFRDCWHHFYYRPNNCDLACLII